MLINCGWSTRETVGSTEGEIVRNTGEEIVGSTEKEIVRSTEGEIVGGTEGEIVSMEHKGFGRGSGENVLSTCDDLSV